MLRGGKLVMVSAVAVAVVGLLVLAAVFFWQTDAPAGLISRDSGWAERSGVSVAGAKTSPHQGNDTPMVASLRSLLPKLEAKVAANPNDIGQQILLAQSYVELGQRQKGLQRLRDLHKKKPGQHDISFILASVLMKSADKIELLESSRLFRAMKKDSTMAQNRKGLLDLYYGQVLLRLDKKPQAVKIWRMALKRLPAADRHRSLIQSELARAANRTIAPLR